MGSFFSEGEGEQFFDSREELSSVSDLGSDGSEDCSSSFGFGFDSGVGLRSRYGVWINSPDSVHARRCRFLKWMGLSVEQNSVTREELGIESVESFRLDVDRITDNGGAVLRTLDSEDGFLSTQSSMSSRSNQESFESEALDSNLAFTIRNLDDGTEFVVDELDHDGMITRLHEVGSNRSFSFDEFQRSLGSSPLIQRLLSRYVNDARGMVEVKKKAKRSWLSKLSSAGRIVERRADVSKHNGLESTVGGRMHRVKVYPSKKRSKELSSLYSGQEFLAHKGSILTMKFSLDGQYLATGGEDGVVRVWKVIEDDRLDQFNIPASDPSCLYFTVNHLSQLASIDVDQKKIGKTKLHKSSESTCVVLPPKVFRVLENPLHEFHGHSAEILDLSWSKNKVGIMENPFLLSSSADKTVCLWQVGCDRCLSVFSHNNYVTCVDFNPADDNYFISGSIDGKVRIWEVLDCRVVDYTDIREIVTAVCYRPGGKGGIVGTMIGNCFFYDIKDNQLLLDAQICLKGKKKLQGRRITGFEFSPNDPSKLIVTSADSVVRILCGMDIVCKFRASGLGLGANQLFASFTSDGKHIISTAEDSYVYLWNYTGQEGSPSRVKKIQSYESFMSPNASIALSWSGIKILPETLSSPSPTPSRALPGSCGGNDYNYQKFNGESDHKMVHGSPDCFSLTRGFLLDSLNRGSATWPEEKLPDSSPVVASTRKCKSQYKLLKSACQSMFSSSHMWGLVVVTAGWDGRIRTYLNYGLPLRF